ncbi:MULTISPECIES: hypothetical protein [unclassified Mesorhizobium]|uniref:hypothetical protein n=1 Tax=unclassified Mesorhizobium TaxID=325217 RepID=UPI0003CF79BF|nr:MULTISPECIES: hypothetical protein [unclassified Mesorhizobium]ESY59431.1 hypothetical protein X744_12800 [Mesorhizobium sp. LNJC372A00]WJI79500.1 hypothetical protein NLY34_21885 [Mesorhizobium sp. C374B]WJI86035.1 hypothetical protein NLY42_24280 [Mesorhizobium sp. C372A]
MSFVHDRREVRRFKASDDEGNIYRVIEYTIAITPSGEARRDALSNSSQHRTEFYLEDRTRIFAHETEAKAYKIDISHKIIRQVS